MFPMRQRRQCSAYQGLGLRFAGGVGTQRKESHVRYSSLGKVAVATFSLALAAGCENMGGNKGGGQVTDRDQQQHTNPDGTQVRQRSQVRQTQGGQAIKETETQTRQPVSPGSNADADATPK